MTEKLKMDLEELEKTIKLLEIQLANVEIRYTSGEINEDTYRKENETLEQGLSVLEKEAEKTKEMLEGIVPSEVALPKEKIRAILEKIPIDKAFYFYTDYGKYTGKRAESLEEIAEIITKVEAGSLRFHLSRGDFQSWIIYIDDSDLALQLDILKKRELNDEELRNKIHKIVKSRIESLKKKLENSKSFQ